MDHLINNAELSNENIFFNDYFHTLNTDLVGKDEFKFLNKKHGTFDGILQVVPTFLNKNNLPAIEQMTIAVAELIKSIPFRVFNNDISQLSEFYNLPEDYIEYRFLNSLNNINQQLTRGDYIKTKKGYKCIEFNVGVSLGGWQSKQLHQLYNLEKVTSDFFQMKSLNYEILDPFILALTHIIDDTLSNINEVESEINLVRLVNPDADKTDIWKSFNDQFNLYFESQYKLLLESKNLKGQTFNISENDLKVNEDFIYYKDKKIHCIIDWDIDVELDKIIPFKKKNVNIFSGGTRKILGSKLNLAVLSDEAYSHFFSDSERETIKKYIPWTRVLERQTTKFNGIEIDLDSFLKSNKDLFIVKISNSHSGDEVFSGVEMNKEGWTELVESILNDLSNKWIVQEKLESCQYSYYYEGEIIPHNLIWGFFVFGSKYSGDVLRMAPKELSCIISASKGGSISNLTYLD